MNLAKYLYEKLQDPLIYANKYLYNEDLSLRLVRNKDRSHTIEIHPSYKLYEQAENLFSPIISGDKFETFPPRYTWREGKPIFSLQKEKDSRDSPVFVISYLGFIIHFHHPIKFPVLPAPIQLNFVYAFSPDKNGDIYRKLVIPLEDPNRFAGTVKFDSYIVRSSDAVPSCLSIYLLRLRETRLNKYDLSNGPQYHVERLLESLDDTGLDRYASYIPNMTLDFFYLHSQKVELFPDTFVWLRSGIGISLPLRT